MEIAHSQQDRVAFGFWVYIMSDCLLFASLFATFAVLRMETFGGPSGQEIFHLPFIFTETVILLTSSFTIGLAMLAAYHGKRWHSVIALVATLCLGIAFLYMEVSEFKSLVMEGNGPSRSAFLSSFFTLVGTHGFHVFIGTIWMTLLTVRIALMGFVHNMQKLLCLSIFWHFLDVVWIFIFTIVYLFGVIL